MDKVLIIDDDAAMRDVLRQILELDGYEVLEAVDGEQGLQVYAESPVTVVITDIIMPHRDGISFTDELKQRFPEVRVIAISGGDRIEKFERAVEANVNRVITKPFDQDELLDAVAQLMEPSPVN